jgi:hypothetical protein
MKPSSETLTPVVKWSVTAVLILFPAVPMVRAAIEGSSTSSGPAFLIGLALLLPALIYAAAVHTKWCVIIVGALLVLITAQLWAGFYSLAADNPLAGIVPIFGSLYTTVIAAAGAVVDGLLRYRRTDLRSGRP